MEFFRHDVGCWHAGDADKARGPDSLLPHHLQLRAAVQHNGGALWPLTEQRAKMIALKSPSQLA